MSIRALGFLVGLVLGIVWIWLGFGAALLSLALGIVGWLVAAVIASVTSGSTSVSDLWNDLAGRRSTGA